MNNLLVLQNFTIARKSGEKNVSAFRAKVKKRTPSAFRIEKKPLRRTSKGNTTDDYKTTHKVHTIINICVNPIIHHYSKNTSEKHLKITQIFFYIK